MLRETKGWLLYFVFFEPCAPCRGVPLHMPSPIPLHGIEPVEGASDHLAYGRTGDGGVRAALWKAASSDHEGGFIQVAI
jgi:hypothetical protein